MADKCPKCDIVEIAPTGYDRNAGFETTLTALRGHPEMKGMYALFDDLALGAVKAAKQADRSDLVIAGHDGVCDALKSIIDGDLDFTIYLPGAPFGEWIVEAAKDLRGGSKVEDGTLQAGTPVSKQIVDDILSGKSDGPADVPLKPAVERAASGCK